MDDDRKEQRVNTSSKSSPTRDTCGEANRCPACPATSNDEHFQKGHRSLELDLEATVAKYADRLEAALTHKVTEFENAMTNRVDQLLADHVKSISKYVDTCFNQVCSLEDANDGQTLSQTVKDLCSRLHRENDEAVTSAMQAMLQRQDKFLERMLRQEVILFTNTLGLVRHKPFDPTTAPPAYNYYHI
ncbi:hypothetical protein PGT21_027008 [Puccinia graminis f. sp. tritici]|uniref:Uncharacterized protein n=2 Tax=Puccinia graminis f. sp. tritici TaxID=56615 RepID=E3K722_PUCGT|nr:uncharacterized protein PGTG_05323 [Puccinia graminis f. sp. tritici CRL 75-36-700-3]EFP80098.1 hypothetical protein PGTG_05323 [Puccinia graminis f. sp. tritici CRL 75-36-700-3]KAA1110593.1 hypothetical protein PGT21_027008 [Puccinia graminis f. sp. tritici]